MGNERVYGQTRLYTIEAAVTCVECGCPIFVGRHRMEELPAKDRLECPSCRVVMRIGVYLEKERTQ